MRNPTCGSRIDRRRSRNPVIRAHARLTRALAARVAQARSLALTSARIPCRSARIVGTGIVEARCPRVLPHPCGRSPRRPLRLRLYLRSSLDETTVRSILVHDLGVEEGGDPGLPLDLAVTGEIRALHGPRRLRPASGGVSLGGVRGPTGTFGCLARGRGRVRRNRTFILSTHHVLAGPGANFGDPILQPGPEDGGRPADDRIAVLERHVPLDFEGGTNRVDCATAWADPEGVRPEILTDSRRAPETLSLAPDPREARPGSRVGKSGRSTGHTRGVVELCSASVLVRYGNRTALFEDQLEIRGLGGPFAAPGDSGALVWTQEPPHRPVGLVFAGGRQVAFANPISWVLDALDLQLQR